MTSAPTTDDLVTAVGLRLFGSQGYSQTSMEQVRREAGISNGSLYHLYRDKAALAAHLYCRGMVESQDGILDAVRGARAAEDGVRGAVVFQTGWVDANVELARLIYADLPDAVLAAAAPTLDRLGRSYVREVDGWLRRHVDSGAVVDRPFVILHALWLGPTQEFCRHWLRGRARLRPRHVAADLADGAWRAIAA
jgi:AcrR family transcriptional regulator